MASMIDGLVKLSSPGREGGGGADNSAEIYLHHSNSSKKYELPYTDYRTLRF